MPQSERYLEITEQSYQSACVSMNHSYSKVKIAEFEILLSMKTSTTLNNVKGVISVE